MLNFNQYFMGFPHQIYYIQHVDHNSLIMPTLIMPNFQLYPTTSNFKPTQPNSTQTSTLNTCEKQLLQAKETKVDSQEHQNESFESKKVGQDNKNDEGLNDQDIQSRNILPNNINLLLSHLRRINKSGKLINKIIDKYNRKGHAYTPKKFYSYQLYLKDTVQYDISRRTLRSISTFQDPSCPIFSLEEQLFYNKVFRIAAHEFLREESILSIISSRKTYKTRKIDHLRAYRIILRDIAQKSQSKNEKC